VDGSYRVRFAGTAANRVRGIVELDNLDHGRGLRYGNPEHSGVVG
jgi:hypothetical protein